MRCNPSCCVAGSDPARINSVGVVVGGDGAGTRHRLRRARRAAIRRGSHASTRSPAAPCCSVRRSCRPPVGSTSRTSSTTRILIWLVEVRRSAGRINVSRRAWCGTGSALRPLNWATKLGICRNETVSDSRSGSVTRTRFGERYGYRSGACVGALGRRTRVRSLAGLGMAPRALLARLRTR